MLHFRSRLSGERIERDHIVDKGHSPVQGDRDLSRKWKEKNGKDESS